MTIQSILDFFEEIAPLHLQESYDNAGLIVGNPEMPVKGVLTCLDSTEKIIDEAISIGANVVLAHHPIVFRGLKTFTGADYVQRVILKAIKNDVAIIAMHTNLDNVLQHGVNQRIAEKIGLENVGILQLKDIEKEEIGSGILGDLPKPMKTLEFLTMLKEKMEVNCVKYTTPNVQDVRKIAVCGGSGGFLLSTAKKRQADVFITADYKYHEFFDANNEIIIADIGHYESEQFTIDLLNELINKNFSTFAAQTTKENTNPVNYL